MKLNTYHHMLYPPIPENTARKARSTFGSGNIYLIIGDRLDELLTGFIPQERKFLDAHVLETFCLYLLITAIQFREHMTDMRLVETLPRRSDIQYALHLPEDFLGINPRSLCEFRQELLSDSLDLCSFQVLLDRLSNLGAFCAEPAQKIGAAEVVTTTMVCSCLEGVMDAVCSTLERISMEEPARLDPIALAHWRDRYRRDPLITVWSTRVEDWRSLAREIGTDVNCLLDAVSKFPGGKSTYYAEVAQLKNSWEVLTEVMMNVDDQGLENPGKNRLSSNVG